MKVQEIFTAKINREFYLFIEYGYSDTLTDKETEQISQWINETEEAIGHKNYTFSCSEETDFSLCEISKLWGDCITLTVSYTEDIRNDKEVDNLLLRLESHILTLVAYGYNENVKSYLEGIAPKLEKINNRVKFFLE